MSDLRANLRSVLIHAGMRGKMADRWLPRIDAALYDDGWYAVPSRDTEIEQIERAIPERWRMANRTTVRVEGSPRFVAEVLYDAGLRSQPASEPSLLPGEHVRVLPGYDVMFEDDNGNPIQPASEPSLDVARLTAAVRAADFDTDWDDDAGIAEAIAAEYQRLSQPADNEAAE